MYNSEHYVVRWGESRQGQAARRIGCHGIPGSLIVCYGKITMIFPVFLDLESINGKSPDAYISEKPCDCKSAQTRSQTLARHVNFHRKWHVDLTCSFRYLQSGAHCSQLVNIVCSSYSKVWVNTGDISNQFGGLKKQWSQDFGHGQPSNPLTG